MRNTKRVFVLILCAFALGVGCTRMSGEGEVPAPKEETPAKESLDDAAVSPLVNTPDVKIDPSAEIPSDKDVTNFKVPDVQIDATKGMDDIDDTRVDGEDDVIDEP